MATTQEPHTPLLNTVLGTMGSDIVSGNLPAGERFTLNDICQRFDISRTVAREAMRALEQLGMVASSRRVGITVLPISEWAVYDSSIITWRLNSEKSRDGQRSSLNELRLAIEPTAASLAAQHGSQADKEEILELAQRLHAFEDTPARRVGEQLATDLRFHTMVLHASGNEMFAALSPLLLSMVRGRSVFGSRKRNPTAGTARLHLDLAHAIHSGDANEAEKIARAILTEARAKET